jgi:uncharacterized integral membrane protein (TIGR00698 family)
MIAETKPDLAAGSCWPGLAVAILIASGAWMLMWAVGLEQSPLSGLPISMMLLAILAGLALAGPAARNPSWTPGLEMARGWVLKAAVALIGLRLALGDVAELGIEVLPLVILAIVIGLGLVLGLSRLAGVPARLAALIAAGTAICGASAIAATAPGIRARSDEVCYAIACIALLGLAATLVYPWLLQLVLEDSHLVGFAVGVLIHDTAQVTAAAVFHEQTWQTGETLNAATVAKLMRNLAMLIVVPGLIWWLGRGQSTQSTRVPLPLFIVAFLLLSGGRTLGDVWLGTDHAAWNTLIQSAGFLSQFGFAMAMAALAMAVRPAELRHHGWRPALIAIISSLGMLMMALWWLS